MTEENLYPRGESSPKKAYQSKTLWVNLLMAGASFFPQVQVFLSPDVVSTIFLAVNAVLRFTTKSAITIK